MGFVRAPECLIILLPLTSCELCCEVLDDTLISCDKP